MEKCGGRVKVCGAGVEECGGRAKVWWEGWCVGRSEVCGWGWMDVDGGRVRCGWAKGAGRASLDR